MTKGNEVSRVVTSDRTNAQCLFFESQYNDDKNAILQKKIMLFK